MNPHAPILLACLVLLTGCIGTHITMPGATDNDYNSAPPMPPGAETKMFPKMSLRSSLVEPTTPVDDPPQTKYVTLAWDANTETNLAGYNVYYGTASRSYAGVTPVDSGSTTASITNLTPGTTYYFAVTATNTYGLESDYSMEVSWRVPFDAPQPPMLHGVLYVKLTPHALRSTNLADWQPMTLEPTYVAATNAQEFYRVTGLGIEPVKLANTN